MKQEANVNTPLEGPSSSSDVTPATSTFAVKDYHYDQTISNY